MIDSDYKFVVLLNKKVPDGQIMNACAHMCACLGGKADDALRQKMGFINYIDMSNGEHPVSGQSLIVLKAKNSNQIRTTRNAAIENHIYHVDFLESMTVGNYAEQMKRTSELSEEDLEYWGLALFGLKEKIDPITKKFSLW